MEASVKLTRALEIAGTDGRGTDPTAGGHEAGVLSGGGGRAELDK
jgi:hypothetical protein